MIEIFKISLIFFIFGLFLFSPINVSSFNKKKEIDLNIVSFNLIINCSLLLMLSLIPIALSFYNFFYLILCFLIVLYNYLLKSIDLNKIKENIISIFIFFLIFFIISLNVANELELSWDSKYFYYSKSLFFAENQILYDIKRFIFGTWHPHLGSFFWAFFWNLSLFDHEYYGRLFYVFIAVYSLFYICNNNLKYNFTNLFIFILLFLIFYKYERFSGAQEILIFSFLAIMSKFFFQLKSDNKNFFLFYILLACNLILWIKVEGIIYSSILIFLINLNPKIKLKSKFYISIAFLFLVFLKIFIYEFLIKESNFLVDGHPYNLNYIFSLNLEIIFYKMKYLILYFSYYVLNNLFYILAILILFSKICFKDNDNYSNIIILYLILNLTFIFFAYIFRDMEILYSIRTTLDRVVFTSSGFFTFIVINHIQNLKKPSIFK